MTVATNIAKVKSRIAAACNSTNREDSPPQLLAVSKKKPASAVEAAVAQGLNEFGENYVQEGIDKIAATAHLAITWHFIGPIQSNKTKDIAQHFDWVHTLERTKIIKRLNDARTGRPLQVCIQVNISEEANKSGCTVEDISTLAHAIDHCDNLNLRGLMAIPAADGDNQAAFAAMHALWQDLKTQYPQVETLSMGMSGDMEAAIAHGSTMVRVGTDIFGARTL